MTTDVHAVRVWRSFCQRFAVLDQSVPLFAADEEGVVAHRQVGRGNNARPVLVRSPAMEALVLAETTKLVEDWEAKAHRYDGLIYCMGWSNDELFMPLYVGKAETIGKGQRNLSANIKRLRSDRSKFARWGDNYAYHIGDLSACVLPGHQPARISGKYKAWATKLFEDVPSLTPKLRRPVYFWAKAWDRTDVGVWEELGPTSLAFLEYLLIGVAGRASADLLNREGVGRAAG